MSRLVSGSTAVVRHPLRWLVTVVLVATAGLCAAEPAPNAAGANASSYAQLPLRRDAEPFDAGWRMLVALGVLAAVAGVMLVRARRPAQAKQRRALPGFGWPPRSPGGIDILERRRVNASCELSVVRWNGEELLLASNPGDIAIVARRPVGTASGEGAP